VTGLPGSPDAKRAAYARILEVLPPRLDAAIGENDLYEIVVAALHELPAYDWTGVYVLSEPGLLTLGPYRGAPTDHVRIPVGRGVCGQSAERDATVVVEDVTVEPNYLACSLETRSEIVVPIRVRGRYRAQIDVDSHTPAAFDAVDREALERLADEMGAALEALGVEPV
jgi:GAF domain-containing protein